jgi:hypothetical protein
MSAPPGREALLERERRWLRPAGALAILGALLFAAGIVVQQIGLPRADTDPERLTQFHDHATKLIAGEVLQGAGFALFAAPLYVLFQAAAARSERVRRSMVAFCFIGPVLFGIATISFSFGIRDVADSYVEKAPAIEQKARQDAAAAKPPKDADQAADDALQNLADDVADDSTIAKVGTGLRFAAVLGLVIGMVYIVLWSMRTGLLTRFWGTLGMALGVSLILLGLFGLMGLVLWFAAIGVMLIGRWPGGLPPAWAAGKAIPPVRPGEEAAGELGDVEGSGREVAEPPLPEDDSLSGEGPVGAGPDQPSDETQGQRRKKRKRR